MPYYWTRQWKNQLKQSWTCVQKKCLSSLTFVILLMFSTFMFCGLLYLMDTKYGQYRNTFSSLTIHCNEGRLGNQMCTYAVLYGLTELNNRPMTVLSCNAKLLKEYFTIDFPIMNKLLFRERNPWIISSFFHPEDLNISRTSNIIKGYEYPCSYTFFDHVRTDIRRLFRFLPSIQTYAQETLARVKGKREDVTFVGVHVRRTDYLIGHKYSWLRDHHGREVDLEYFVKARDYFKSRYSNVIFPVVSDDRTWCREHLTPLGLHVLDDSPTPGHDMAILANCNHTIMTYGSFGFWGAYLAGGEAVYFKNFLKTDTYFMKHTFHYDKMYLPDWIGLTTNYNDSLFNSATDKD